MSKNRRSAIKPLLLALFPAAPVFGCFRYYTQLKMLSDDFRPLYEFWLLPKWSIVLYASNMYLWGSILGLILGLYVWRKETVNLRLHLQQFIRLAKLTLLAVISGVLVWLIFDIWYSGIDDRSGTTFADLFHNMLAFLAVFQYIFFWGVLGYGLCFAVRSRVLSFALLIGVQAYELFWGIHHLQRLELVLPTAISRIPIALAYPVWKKDSWAADYPSLIASSPMTFTAKYQIVDVGLLWVLAVEVIYILLIGCVLFLNDSKRVTKTWTGIQS